MRGANEPRAHGIPAQYRGVWRRLSLRIADGPPFENSEVVWLQTHRYFADLRTPTCMHGSSAPVAAFSGIIRWDAPRVTFQRDLDLSSAVEDCADLDLLNGDLVERGTYRYQGRSIPYEEIWRCWRKPHGLRRVLDGHLPGDSRISMRLVEIGDVAMVLVDERPRGDFTAVQFVRHDATWHEVRRVGATAISAPPSMTAASIGQAVTPQTADPVWTCRTWVLRESSNGAD